LFANYFRLPQLKMTKNEHRAERIIVKAFDLAFSIHKGHFLFALLLRK